jgi:RNA polymerase sigma-70 factor (ECF subfamily)
MLWRILGNEQDVCDAYQDTFLQLAHCQGQKKPEHIKAYIFRTATNVAISMIRRKMADRRLSETIAKSTVAPDKLARQSQAASELDVRNLQDSLRYYVAELPDNLRNVITLRDLAELSYAQVGRILGITAGSARVYRCKAIQLLAVWMNNGKARP